MLKEKQKKRIEKEIKAWDEQKRLLQEQERIRQQKEKIFEEKNKKKKEITTTKGLMFFLFFSCTIIEIFTMYVTIKSMNSGYAPDFGPLSMLISAIVAQVVGFAIYYIKNLKENTKGGIIYQAAMFDRILPEQCENIQEAQG